MKSKNSVLFVAPINIGNKPRGGAEAKNQILLKKLKQDYGRWLRFIDMSQKRTLKFFQLIVFLFIYDRIVISIASTALKKLSFFNFILSSKKTTVFVIGGVVDKKINGGRLQKLFENAGIVYAETKELKNKIAAKSSEINVEHLPNFKEIPKVNVSDRPIEGEIKLAYLSRIHKDKGIFRCVDLVERLNREDPQRDYKLDVFGNFDLSSQDKKKFDKEVQRNYYISYKGFLNLDSRQGYEELSKYHFFLFLTNHPGEGFPGVLIDAMIAGVPIIASDWKYNSEILGEGETSLGEIVDLNNDWLSEVSKSILEMVSQHDKYYDIKQGMQKEVEKYNIETIDIEIA